MRIQYFFVVWIIFYAYMQDIAAFFESVQVDSVRLHSISIIVFLLFVSSVIFPR